MSSKKILFFLLILLAPSAIVYAQDSIRVDTSGVWYTYRQDVNALRCLMTEEKKAEKLEITEDELNFCRGDLSISVDLSNSLLMENTKLYERIKKQQKALKIVGGGLGAALIALVFAVIF